MTTREVPLRTKILYGVADTGLNIKNASINQFLLFFYVDIIHIAPTLVGIAIFIGKLWDGLADPLMGYISDATRSRWGRRRPWIVVSALPMGIFYYLLFSPPDWTPTALVIWLGVVSVVLFTFLTIFATPYLAWGAELARDYHERTTVVQIRALFGVLGGVIGGTAPILIANALDRGRAGYSAMAIALGVLITVTTLVTGLCVREEPRPAVSSASFGHFVRGLRGTFANREFALVFGTFCLMTVSAAIGQSVQLIVIKYRLGMYDFFPWIALTFALSFAGSFPLWLALSRRFGKQRAMLGGLALSCFVPFGWIVVEPGQHVGMLGFMMLGGVVAGSLTLVISQAADVIDLDELVTGEQRAGTYFGIWTFGLKMCSALGTFIGSIVLSAVGYVADQDQDPSTLWWLVMVVGPMQAVVHLCGLLAFRRIRFDELDVAQAQAALAARRAASTTAPTE